MRSVTTVWLIACVALAAIGLLYLGSLASDCSQKQGVLVRSAFGFPVCIEQGQHR